MKKILILLAGLMISSTASAGVYYGAKTGDLSIDDSGFGSTSSGALMLGYGLPIPVLDLAVEAEYMTTLSDGSGPAGTDYSASSLGAYAAFRTPGPIYFKLKAGLADTTVDVGGTDFSETLNVLGLGAGFSIGLAAVEAEWTMYQEGSDIGANINMLSVGVKF